MGSFEAYEQRLKRHNEDFVGNASQSKLKLRSQNKENGGKKNGEEGVQRDSEINWQKFFSKE